jgi:hypothetical protein
MRPFALAAALFVLLPATASRAGQITLAFDLSGSSVSVLGLINIPPAGTITSAMATLTIPGSALDAASPGAAFLENLSLAATLDTLLFGNVLTGTVTADQIGVANGSLMAGLSVLALAPPFVLNVDALLNCAGSLCGVLEGLLMDTFPVMLSGAQTLSEGFSVMVGNLNQIGAATIGAMFTFDLGGVTVEVNLVGSEIAQSRSFSSVPEPGSGLLVAGTLVGLAGVRRARRRIA